MSPKDTGVLPDYDYGPPLRLEIGEILANEEPECTEMSCLCGDAGMLQYGIWPWSASANGVEVRVQRISAYRCDKCAKMSLPLAVIGPLGQLIRKAEEDFPGPSN